MIEIIVLAILALSAFYYFNHKIKSRREDERERLREKREEYMNKMLEQLRNRDKPSPDEKD